MGCLTILHGRNRGWLRRTPWARALAPAVACVLALAGTCTLTPAAHAEASAAGDAAQRAAEQLLQQVLQGNAAAVLEQATPELRAPLDADRLRAIVGGIRAQAGQYRGQLAAQRDLRGTFEVVTLTCAFERANIDVRMVFTAAGQLAGLSMRPAAATVEYKSPDYANAARFSEREVQVGADGWPLPGTLTLPRGDASTSASLVPAVVLVHGSGPSDRDATLGPNRIFRDLAEGLASRGVAVLRYEKRTRAHEARVASRTDFDVDDEVTDDAAAAVAWLRRQPGIDRTRIHVLGFSLGGMLAPRIALAAPEIAGIISLAGSVQPLEQAMLAQTQYIAGFDGRIDDAERGQLAELMSLVARVQALKRGDPPIEFAGSSAPASYWLSLRGIDPPATAARLPQAVLVLQGERDFQVPMADFARWQAALAQHPRARCIAYPGLNHLFVRGTGRSHPNEYALAGHVAVEVVDDIARWILATPPVNATPTTAPAAPAASAASAPAATAPSPALPAAPAASPQSSPDSTTP